MPGLGRRTWAAGEVVTASNVQNYLQDQAVMVFATATARDAAITSPSEGMLAYLSDSNTIVGYDGTNWVPAPLMTSQSFGFRNRLINGSFDVWQRGTPVNTSGSGVSNYGPDRWRFGNNGAASQYNLSRVTNSSTAPCAYAMRLTSARTADSLNGLEYCMEYLDVAKLWGQTLTLSFWVRASTNITIGTQVGAGTLTTDVYPGVGVGLTGAATLGSANTNVTTSWQRVVIPCSTLTSSYGQLRIILVTGMTINSGTWLEFSGVQLETGNTVTPFETRPFQVEAAMCQRYYEKSWDIDTAPNTNTNNGLYFFSGSSDVNGQVFVPIQFKVEKRSTNYNVTFNINTGGSLGNWAAARNGANVNVAMAANYKGTKGFNATTGSVGAGWVVAQAFGHWTADAEL